MTIHVHRSVIEMGPKKWANSYPSSRWCCPTISCSVIPFSSCLQSFPAWRSFPMRQIFTSGPQSIGASASASFLPMNVQDGYPLELTGYFSLQSKGGSRIFPRRNKMARGAGGHRIQLSPQIHQEYTFKHKSACRIPTESAHEYMASRKEYIDPRKTQDRGLSLYSGSIGPKILDYQRTNPRDIK